MAYAISKGVFGIICIANYIHKVLPYVLHELLYYSSCMLSWCYINQAVDSGMLSLGFVATLLAVTPRTCARGKVIGSSVCRRCRHKKGPIWTLMHFCVLSRRPNYWKNLLQTAKDRLTVSHTQRDPILCVCGHTHVLCIWALQCKKLKISVHAWICTMLITHKVYLHKGRAWVQGSEG